MRRKIIGMRLALSIAAALLFATGGFFMKTSDGLTRLKPTVALFLCFGFGAACQSLAMKRSEMGSVYILVLGLEAIAAFALAMLVLDERVTLAKSLGIALIGAGVWLLSR